MALVFRKDKRRASPYRQQGIVYDRPFLIYTRKNAANNLCRGMNRSILSRFSCYFVLDWRVDMTAQQSTFRLELKMRGKKGSLYDLAIN